MIIYGKNVWKTISENPKQIKEIYIQSGLKDPSILQQVKASGLAYKVLNRQQLDTLTETSHHQGIACKVKDIQTVDVKQLMGKSQCIVALDGIQDPHNVGAILRTCDCTGVSGLILTKHKSAGLTPAAIKASTGAAYTVPVSIVNNLSNTLKQLKKEGYWIVGSDMDHARDYREGIYDVPICLVIGSEGKGISSLVKKQCDYMVSLPMEGKMTSLNASVACAVLLYEIHSQRNPL